MDRERGIVKEKSEGEEDGGADGRDKGVVNSASMFVVVGAVREGGMLNISSDVAADVVVITASEIGTAREASTGVFCVLGDGDGDGEGDRGVMRWWKKGCGSSGARRRRRRRLWLVMIMLNRMGGVEGACMGEVGDMN
jgi:hypothetical protein